MVYILNRHLKDSQRIRTALQEIFGIGKFLSNQICDQLGFSKFTCVGDLTSYQKDQLLRILNQYYFTLRTSSNYFTRYFSFFRNWIL